MGERELALGLMDYALRSLGLREAEVRSIVQTVRASGEGGAFDRRADVEPEHGAPELRPHRADEDEAAAVDPTPVSR